VSSTKLVFIVVSAFQPTIRRLNASMTNATYTTPDHVITYVKSATQSRLGAGALKSRSTKSTGRSPRSPGIVVRRFLPRTTPWRPSARIRRSTVHRATSMPSRCNCHHTFSAP